jgi:hypothetical protein
MTTLEEHAHAPMDTLYRAGGRVFLFLRTDDFRQDYRAMKEGGVTFVVVFEDPMASDGTLSTFGILSQFNPDVRQQKRFEALSPKASSIVIFVDFERFHGQPIRPDTQALLRHCRFDRLPGRKYAP